jgi:hypothetical protein
VGLLLLTTDFILDLGDWGCVRLFVGGVLFMASLYEDLFGG